MIMDHEGRRRSGVRRTSVEVAGSVRETRMKSVNEVKFGAKLFDVEDNNEESAVSGTKMKRSSTGRGMVSGERKNAGKGESFDGNEKSPMQMGKAKSDPQKNSGENCKELSVCSADGVKRSPVQMRRLKSEGTKVAGSVAADKFDRSPTQIRKQRLESLKGTAELGKEITDEAIERSTVQLKKAKSDSVKILGDSSANAKSNVDGSSCKDEQSSASPRKSKSEPVQVLEESETGTGDGTLGEVENIPIDSQKSKSDEACEEFGAREEKVISSSTDYVVVEPKKTSPEVPDNVSEVASEELYEDDEYEDEDEEDIVEEIKTETEKESFDIKEITTPEPKTIVSEEKKFNQISERLPPISVRVKKPASIRANSTIHQGFSKINSSKILRFH